jgi:PRP1 splicing factor, N-terminal
MLKEQLERMRANNPKITEQFADLKRDLAQVRHETSHACVTSVVHIISSAMLGLGCIIKPLCCTPPGERGRVGGDS